MTPKEKAETLISQYLWPQRRTEFARHDIAKECALIAVDEILSVIPPNMLIILYNHWQEVKAEIEKL